MYLKRGIRIMSLMRDILSGETSSQEHWPFIIFASFLLVKKAPYWKLFFYRCVILLDSGPYLSFCY